jgi:hypothetical protein
MGFFLFFGFWCFVVVIVVAILEFKHRASGLLGSGLELGPCLQPFLL